MTAQGAGWNYSVLRPKYAVAIGKPMTLFESLDRLSSQALHDRAWHHAERHLNARCFWDLLEMIPSVEAANGNTRAADADVSHPAQEVRGRHSSQRLPPSK